MPLSIRIGLIGDYDPEVTAHRAIPMALELAATLTGKLLKFTWIGTRSLGKSVVHPLLRRSTLFGASQRVLTPTRMLQLRASDLHARPGDRSSGRAAAFNMPCLNIRTMYLATRKPNMRKHAWTPPCGSSHR